MAVIGWQAGLDLELGYPQPTSMPASPLHPHVRPLVLTQKQRLEKSHVLGPGPDAHAKSLFVSNNTASAGHSARYSARLARDMDTRSLDIRGPKTYAVVSTNMENGNKTHDIW